MKLKLESDPSGVKKYSCMKNYFFGIITKSVLNFLIVRAIETRYWIIYGYHESKYGLISQ